MPLRLGVFVFVFSFLAFAEGLPKSVLDVLPNDIDLNNSLYSDAVEELSDTIKNCGSGVVEGVAESNSCSFKIHADKEFFENHAHRTGFQYTKDWANREGVTFYEPTGAEVPDNFDLRDLMKNGVPEIKRQYCGDCWAWATHHGLEITRAVHDSKVYDHSIQTVLSCSKKGTCGGGYMSAVDFLKYGLPLEPEFPYAGSDKSCKYNNADIQMGWNGKVQGTPYVGSSLDHSLALGNSREGSKVKAMMQAMYKWKSPLVVTVASYSMSGGGVYDSCSALNSGGNHMVAIVGWEMWNGKRVAHVWNSHGQGHGQNGVSRIVWECGEGRLNRGLGYSAKIVQYKAPCVAPDASQTYFHEVMKGSFVKVGAEQSEGTKCSWTPREGLTDPDSCVTQASPSMTTEYHLTATNDCGTSSSMAMVHVWGYDKSGNKVKTPYGITRR